MVQPVAQTVGMAFVYFADGDIDVETLVDFLFSVFGCENDAHRKDVVDFLKGHMLVLHLVPNGIRAFHSGLYLIFHSKGIQGLPDR